ncbi:MAG: hypothetical protein U9R25_10110 [Chloroflexota bacterium]|nr:hypothetical protein [Chloroflexota bacterium]
MSTSSRIAAFLSYLLLIIGWLYVFLFRRHDSFAKFHAWQSILIVGAAILCPIIWAAVGWLLFHIPIAGPIVAIALFSFVIVVIIGLLAGWIVGMISAFQGKVRKIPVLGDWAERLTIGWR